MNKTAIVVIVNLLLILSFVLFQTTKREKLIAQNEAILFKLRPVDPRSLMQGDYMILRYAVTSSWSYRKSEVPSKGYMVFTTDINNIAQLTRFQKEPTPLNKGEQLIKFIKNNGDISIGSESFFFEEGTGKQYERAQYGALKVDKKGDATLVGLCGRDREFIGKSTK